ncbi:DEAD/DEAH box helicase [Corynebacterium sp. B5-R-101]|uniref:DEAD/DEAH box helicase n=1 Tax=Corynebacterium intestinale TaxID=2943492 RepID=A0ABT0TB22_9CORY|nr:DEAD/DEAH box helicase [Corynebacterium intestinale]MCL8494290.1 DEAD/DEAH box helicase [Corynebacterium intestinale]MCP1390526.1 DEAD/DEAH box helicase [Corynebacterium intestinale]
MSSLIPTYASTHIVDGLSEYLTTTFSLAEDLTSQQLREFLNDPQGGMFYGPYVRTRLPYAPAKSWDGILGWLPSGFKPYRHQAEAFERLSSFDYSTGSKRRPSPTLVVTGTGSGKTESFLYPILDHCRRSNGSGIKALILYPMNALASDQERRLAKLLHAEAELAGVTAGIYTGEVVSGGRRKVSKDGLISDRSVLRDTPPDILLTNYKMLDQLLLREQDRELWEKSARSLQYLVLDEFHTYDAAQGTDVAMLLRRLGLMLKKYQPEGFLSPEDEKRPLGKVTPVATSATLGDKSTESTEGSEDAESAGATKDSGRDSAASHSDMLSFAYTVFGEQMPPDAVVGETLMTVEEWQSTVEPLVAKLRAVVSNDEDFSSSDVAEVFPPVTPTPSVEVMQNVVDEVAAAVAVSGSAEDASSFDVAVFEAMSRHVFGSLPGLNSSPDLADSVLAMAGNELVCAILREAATPVPLEHGEAGVPGTDIAAVEPLVSRVFPASVLRSHRELAVEFLSLTLSFIAYVRAELGDALGWDGKKFPGVELHLWVREISRIDRAVASSSRTSVFRWSDDGGMGAHTVQAAGDAPKAWLPAIYCRHCGRSGWMLAEQPGGDTYVTAPQEIRRIAISAPERQRPLIDATSEVAQGVTRADGESSRVAWLNLDLPGLTPQAPDEETMEESPVVPVLVYSGEDAEERAKAQQCPSCGEDDAMRFLGSSVATLLSVALSNLFGMDDLDSAEKKTLVFADSVQDAAHRAGFVQSRARAFALRARIWRAVRSFADSSESSSSSETTASSSAGVPLSSVAARMVEHARAESEPAVRARALYELLPPQLKESPRYRAVWEKGAGAAEQRRALAALQSRLDLDLALQFGDRVDLPRSLVTTGTLSVSVGVDDAVLLSAARAVAGTLASDAELLAWARGVVEYMRIAGGIAHPWLKEYLRQDCNPWLLNRRQARAKGIPAFVRGGAPKFPRAGAALKGALGKRDNNATMPLDSQKGWYARWTKAALGASTSSAFDAANQVAELFKQLEFEEVVFSVPTATGGRVYALDPGNIIVREETEPGLLECPVCHLRVGVDAAAREAMSSVACFTLSCTGHFVPVGVEDNYYQRLYRSANTRTVVAEEHTGLVPTPRRKELEDEFKRPFAQQSASAPNVLVATPTLEMGIDIGDLSTVMLSSMPHTVASYVQRVGRAGRLTGNSLIVALVRGRGRALTTLEHPLETIAGSVTAPAAYLSARDIMHRQFVAYLLDSTDVASSVEQLRSARDVFTYASYSVIDALVELSPSVVLAAYERFAATVAQHASAEVLDELRGWCLPGSDGAASGMVTDLQSARERWGATQKLLLSRLEVLSKRVTELKARVEASAVEDDELKNQFDATVASQRFVRKQLEDHADEYWISALERFGLLPNFTLLDDAVEFNLAVSSFNEEVQKFETETYSYSRGVSSALTELAPGNTFYVQGVGAKVDSVELGEHHSALTQWRLCPECSYSEATGAVLSSDEEVAVAAPHVGACPECGAKGFADRDQLINVVEMTKVYATVDAARSAINDISDDRTSLRFHTQLSFDVPEGGRGKAWYLSDSGFGMEYLAHVEMRWLNLGRLGGGSQRTFAAVECEAPLFRVCERCGHLDSDVGANRWQDHAPWCEYRNAAEEHSISFALGRSLGTQAVLVHLPALLGMVESTTLPSLVAALKLGFKEYLGGNPDHLDVEPVRVDSDGSPVDMLLIHDTVPGGTGYLAQFTEPAHVRQMLLVAYRRLASCHCAEEARQCCPSCLLPFARSSQIPQTSREAAVVALRKILADDLQVSTDADPASFSWEGHLTEERPERSEQSKLEQRFVEQLRADLKKEGATVVESMKGNHAQWDISFDDSRHDWVMEEQKQIGGTIPDFVFSTRDSAIRDIAVYLDGEAFHASAVHNRVKDDFDKRNGLYELGYLPWSLTWQDIDARQATVRKDPPAPPVWTEPKLYSPIVEGSDLSLDDLLQLEKDPLTQLLELLMHPEQKWSLFSEAAFAQAAHGGRAVVDGFEKTYLSTVTVGAAKMRRRVRFDSTNVSENLSAWRLFLSLSNMAYLDPMLAQVEVIESAVEDAVAREVLPDTPVSEPTEPAAVVEMTLGWAEAVDAFADEPEVAAALRVMAAAGLPEPDADSVGGEVSGVPVVAQWPQYKVLLLFAEDADDLRASFEAEGYAVFGADFDSVPDSLTAALSAS